MRKSIETIRRLWKDKSLKLLAPRGELLYDGYLQFMFADSLPSVYLTTSKNAIEAVDLAEYKKPIQYFISTVLIAFGVFFLWLPIFYYLASGRARRIICFFPWIFCEMALIDFLSFGRFDVYISPELKDSFSGFVYYHSVLEHMYDIMNMTDQTGRG